MIRIDISENLQPITLALTRLEQTGRNPRSVLQDIGEYLVQATRERFQTKTAPDGSQWADNSASTIAKKKGRNNPLVGESKSLQRIHYRSSNTELRVGSPMEYSAVQQFGATKGQFGNTSKGRPIPFGDIPARPFLGLSQNDETNILDIIQEHLEMQLR